MSIPQLKLSRARESRTAIERIYVIMRHLFNRGRYKPMGVSGEALKRELMVLSPEIYGSINDPEKVELNGLLYVIDRLPRGIEECQFVKLISKEGFEHSQFSPIIPTKRRRNCFRIDEEQMYIEMTRGRSDIYDILTHLTFMYIESEKIRKNALDHKGRKRRDWQMLEELVTGEEAVKDIDPETAHTYLSNVLGRTYEETTEGASRFKNSSNANSLFHIAYWLGKRSIDEFIDGKDREINFSAALRERIGHHIYGEQWATMIKQRIHKEGMLKRPLHIISANLHSVLNSIYAIPALSSKKKFRDTQDVAKILSNPENQANQRQVEKFALKNGMIRIDDTSGTNISVQLFDSKKIKKEWLQPAIGDIDNTDITDPVLLVMDYAFGEQAFETLDELLKPFEKNGHKIPLNVKSISIMGKAGIMKGDKGDVMIPTAFVFEGTADNYPIHNQISFGKLKDQGLKVSTGTMITVLGTSLQNRDILEYFHESSWKAIGLEMEGAHYQKAIQAASHIRNNIHPDVPLRYAYYASDNPLETGHTLASGSLGVEGVKPTYAITRIILEDIYLSGDSN